jgi:hypothetical protein
MDPAESVRSFIRAWNIDSDDERLELLQACCAPDGVFISPQGILAGLEPYSASIGAFRRAFPTATVELGEPDIHNGYVRFRWHTNWNDSKDGGNAQAPACDPLTGDDFVELTPDGLIVKVVSFNGSPSPP